MKKELKIDLSWCKKCGICVEFCPVKVLKLSENGVFINDPSKCILCGLCEQRCPDYAIYLENS